MEAAWLLLLTQGVLGPAQDGPVVQLVEWAEVGRAEPVFLNVYGALESIPRNEFRQPM